MSSNDLNIDDADAEPSDIDHSDAGATYGPAAPITTYMSEDIVVLDEDGSRVGSADELPEGVTIDVWFRAALDDPERPGEPLIGTVTEWTADIKSLDGFPMIQWEVRFVVPGPYDLNPANDPGMPGIDDLRVRFRIEE